MMLPTNPSRQSGEREGEERMCPVRALEGFGRGQRGAFDSMDGRSTLVTT